MKKIRQWLINTAVTQFFLRLLNRIHPPGFEGMSLYELLQFLVASFKQGNYSTRSAAISFYLILAIFPLILVLVSLIPYLPIDGFQAEMLNEIELMTPSSMHQTLLPIFENLILEKHNVALSLSSILTVYYAANSINAILTSFNSSFQIELKRHPVKQWIISILLSIVWAFFSLAAIVLMVVGEDAIRWIQQSLSLNPEFTYYMGHGIKWIVVFLLLIIGITILYNFGNPETKKFKLFSAGSSLAAIVIILASAGFIAYTTNFGSYNELYGSVGSIIVLLLWINLCSRILLIGFELTTKSHVVKAASRSQGEKLSI